MIDPVIALPEFAKDLRLNYSSLLREELMTERQKMGVLLVSALATRCQPLIEAIRAQAGDVLDAKDIAAVNAAASLMAMNNVYYRFTHAADNQVYAAKPARLRMNVIASPGVDKADFELWSLAASAINFCARCINAHEAALRQEGLRDDTIQAAIRYAAVINGLATAISASADPAAIAAAGRAVAPTD